MFDLHCRFLPNDHTFRRNMNEFKKGEVDMDPPPPKFTPRKVWNRVKTYPKVTKGGVKRIHGYGEWHNWRK